MGFNLKAIAGLLLLLAMVVASGRWADEPVEGSLVTPAELDSSAKRVLGPVVSVNELETDLAFIARVDTGAKTCSLHAAEKQIIDGSKYMEENVGKTVRFRVENRRGETEWIEREIAEVRKIRTSEGEETRYLVPMTFTCSDVDREVLVSLNDRSRMTYTMLLGRNFLDGQFIVDVTGADDAPPLLARGL